MSLDQRVQVWLSNIQQSTDDPSPAPEPYADVPPNPMKRRRVDSPPRETWPNIKLSPNDPFYDAKKRNLELRARRDMLDKELAKEIRLQEAKNNMLREKLARMENRTLKRRATASNQVSSEVQQQYCNFISYSTGKVERRLITVPNVPALEPSPPTTSSAPGREQREIKVEPGTEPVSWPEANPEPITEPIERTVVPVSYPNTTLIAPPSPEWERILRAEEELQREVKATMRLETTMRIQARERLVARRESRSSELTALLKRINDIYAGRGILPSSRRIFMRALPGHMRKELAWARGGSQSDVHYCSQRHEVGHEPGHHCVEKVLHQTSRCMGYDALPQEWNMEVVHKVLELSFRDDSTCRKPQLIDFRCSVDGAIVPEYHTSHDIPKPPDFCVYIDPASDPTSDNMPAPIERFEKHVYRDIFNHIDLRSPRNHRPIAFHIHTLPENTEHELQRVKTASAAHRGFLKRLVRLKEIADNGSRYDLPEFLPGIIIYKHNWFLSVSKLDGENARFYGIGDTATSMGVYKIVYALQILRDWVKTVYWPWLQGLLVTWPLDWDGTPL
ncbi:hypothetical protein FPANT_2254 [Fusarium pseudoanthophilum]|uniref:PD-(D/E)XK nuclease-like domain-containing protein n=1 Tax=Fusarium pseudoanthophilum TaxID=48495 RepID=A0A8H5PQU9_9HYPO|nr:hypothetical protein FPANT_2254 [Fusarium pseudoanthophilum]